MFETLTLQFLMGISYNSIFKIWEFRQIIFAIVETLRISIVKLQPTLSVDQWQYGHRRAKTLADLWQSFSPLLIHLMRNRWNMFKHVITCLHSQLWVLIYEYEIHYLTFNQGLIKQDFKQLVSHQLRHLSWWKKWKLTINKL